MNKIGYIVEKVVDPENTRESEISWKVYTDFNMAKAKAEQLANELIDKHKKYIDGDSIKVEWDDTYKCYSVFRNTEDGERIEFVDYYVQHVDIID